MNTLSTTIVQRTVVSCANMAVIDEVESAVEVGLVRAGRLSLAMLLAPFKGKLA